MGKQRRNRNYAFNQSLPSLEGQLILSQQGVGSYRYGRFESHYCGCSWIALYNALVLLGTPQTPGEIIRWMEDQWFFRGLLFGGLLGGYPWSVARYLKNQGFAVTTALGRTSILKKAAGPQVGILFYLRPNFRGHYVAFHPWEDPPGQYRFLNQEEYNPQDIRSLEALFSETKAAFTLGIFVTGKTPAPKSHRKTGSKE